MKTRKWNARTVIRRALIVAETLLQGKTPRFRLDGDVSYYDTDGNQIDFFGDFETLDALQEAYPTSNLGNLAWANGACYRWNGTEWESNGTTYPLSGDALWLDKLETPEFQFTQSTLREVLQNVGRFVHAEPRLDNGVIKFDKLGSGEQSTFDTSKYASKSYQIAVDRYVTNLHSTVNNFVNSIGYANGVMVEPYSNGLKTVRTEDLYVRLEDTNVFIQTQYPIRAIRKLECGFVDNFSQTPPYDITSFVYENTEYQRLSSYEGAYPIAKAWALYYTIGQKGVYGLNFKEQSAMFESFKNYAILNILNVVTGSSVGWTDTTNNNYMTKLAFRITYEPIYSATAQQSKSYIGDLDVPATMVYNQAQNMVESHYFGENMKGAIARLGNVDKVLTYVKNGLFEPPQVGQIILDGNDEYYISAVATEFFPFYTKFSMSLSKDFNRYSDYVKVNSEKRMYEVSERQAFDSHITYKDYVVIGDNNYSVVDDGLFIETYLKILFNPDEISEDYTATLAKLQGYTSIGENLQTVILPVQKTALGNSALFTIKYKDNYSAGDNVVISNENYWQNGVAYSDYFGNIEYLDFTFYNRGSSIPNIDTQTKYGNSLPLKPNGLEFSYTTATTNGIPLWVKKGSTEIPTIDYQVDFVTNRANIIVGSALAKNFPLVTKTTAEHKAKLYVLNKRINKFDKVIDVSNGTPIEDSNWIINLGEGYLQFVSKSSSVEGISWAIVDGKTNELLIGCNKTITNTRDIFEGLKMFIKHDIFKDKINN